MNIALYLASKIKNTKDQTFSSLIIKVGVMSITIAVSVLIISFSVLFGFKSTIKNKLFSLSSHLQISKITLNRSFEETSMPNILGLINKIKKMPEIQSVNKIAFKSIIIKSEEEISGLVFKGVDADFAWNNFQQNIIEGRKLNISPSEECNEIILSSRVCKELNLKLNQKVLVYFIQDPPRARKLKIVGIYDSNVEEMDQLYVLGDLKLVQKVNNWQNGEFGHLEIFINDITKLAETENAILKFLPHQYQIQSVMQLLPQFFEWFNLLDRNIIIVIGLIILVAAFNMISVLLIMIMERTPMIGLLKALGSLNSQIRQIFVYNGAKIIIKGLFYGNILGLGICWIQDKFKLIKLDASNYYMNFVPIEWSWISILLINVSVFLVVFLILFIPSMIIKRINPVNALKYKD